MTRATFRFLDLARSLIIDEGRRSFAEVLIDLHAEAPLEPILVHNLGLEDRIRLLENHGERFGLSFEACPLMEIQDQIHDLVALTIHRMGRDRADEVLGQVYSLSVENGIGLESWSMQDPFSDRTPDRVTDGDDHVRVVHYDGLGKVWRYGRYAWEVFLIRRCEEFEEDEQTSAVPKGIL